MKTIVYCLKNNGNCLPPKIFSSRKLETTGLCLTSGEKCQNCCFINLHSTGQSVLNLPSLWGQYSEWGGGSCHQSTGGKHIHGMHVGGRFGIN